MSNEEIADLYQRIMVQPIFPPLLDAIRAYTQRQVLQGQLNILRRLHDAYNDDPDAEANLFEEIVKEVEQQLTDLEEAK